MNADDHPCASILPQPTNSGRRHGRGGLRFFALVQVPFLALACSASVPLVMDANYAPSWQLGGAPITQSLNLAETFTVGQNGYLSQVGLLVWRNSAGLPQTPLTLSVRTLNGTLPTEPDSGPNILATSALPPTSFETAPTWTSFTFAPVMVSAGEQLALTLSSGTVGYDYYWAADGIFTGMPEGAYTGGAGFDRGLSAARAPGDLTPYSQWGYPYFSGAGGPLVDFGFRTYVAPVPEPSALSLLVLGGTALFGLNSSGKVRGYRRRPH